MDISSLTEEYGGLYLKRKKLRGVIKEVNKGIKESEAQILQYLESNGLKKIPITLEGETMYLSVKNNVALK